MKRGRGRGRRIGKEGDREGKRRKEGEGVEGEKKRKGKRKMIKGVTGCSCSRDKYAKKKRKEQ